jgi:diaminopimelate decarboxylase/aspartate kinase
MSPGEYCKVLAKAAIDCTGCLPSVNVPVPPASKNPRPVEHWTVLKFGGTSVAHAGHWRTIARLAQQRRRDGGRVVIVCSAVAGVTNALQDLARGRDDARSASERLLRRHQDLADDLGIEAGDLLAQFREDLGHAVAVYRNARHDAALTQLLALGELLSSRLGQRFLAQSMEAGWVDARTALTTLPEASPDSRRAWLSARCAAQTDEALQACWSGLAPILLTQGFIAGAEDGSTRLLGRGGSDTSAALLAAALGAEEVEIWTDVPGLFSADPRLVPGALLIRELDHAEALELAASGARVVHPRAIRAAAEAGISLQVRDLSYPELPGTRITAASTEMPEGIKAVTCQRDMLVLLLENLDTRQQVGFLAEVFNMISQAGVSVDLVATSETTTTLAINALANHLEEPETRRLVETLSSRCRVTVYPGCSCVNLVGRGARTALARMAPAARLFRGRPLLMLSQSANDLCMSLLVHAQDAEILVSDLHSRLIGGELANQKVFGPTWDVLKAGA